MHTIQTALAFTLLVTCPALASAQLRFGQTKANLGELRGGPIYQKRLDFVNESSQPIEITDFRLGCGCLQPSLGKRVYQPGEKGTLMMNLRTLGQPNGARVWRAHVQYRVGERTRETALVLEATIRNEVTVEPSILAMTVETTLRQEVVIKDLRDKPMKVIAVRASSPAIRITTEQTAAGVTKASIEVSGDDLKSTRQEATLDIYTDDPLYRHLQVPITLTKAERPVVSATPARVEIAGAGSRLVRLRGKQTVRVEHAEADHPAVTCTWAAGPGDDATLRVRVDPARLAGAEALAIVRVRLAQPAGASISIRVALRKD